MPSSPEDHVLAAEAGKDPSERDELITKSQGDEEDSDPAAKNELAMLVFSLASMEVLSEAGIAVGDFVILILTRNEPEEQLAALVYVTMIEELAMLIMASIAAGIVVALIEAVTEGDRARAAAARLSIVASLLGSFVLAVGAMAGGHSLIMQQTNLPPVSHTIVSSAVLPICLGLLPAALVRTVDNLLSASDGFLGLAMAGITEAIVDVGVFALLQPSMGVSAYPWGKLVGALAGLAVAAVMLIRAERAAHAEAHGDGTFLHLPLTDAQGPTTSTEAEGPPAAAAAVSRRHRSRSRSSDGTGSHHSSQQEDGRTKQGDVGDDGDDDEEDDDGGAGGADDEDTHDNGSGHAHEDGLGDEDASMSLIQRAAPGRSFPSSAEGGGDDMLSTEAATTDGRQQAGSKRHGAPEARPRFTDIWLPVRDGDAWWGALELFLELGLPSAGYEVVELLGHYWIVIVAGTIGQRDVVALRISEGLLWPALVLTMAVLEVAAARASVLVAERSTERSRSFVLVARNLTLAAAAILFVATAVLPASQLAVLFYDECPSNDCRASVDLAKSVTLLAAVNLAIDCVRMSDQLFLRTLFETAEPLAVQAVSASLGIVLGWVLAKTPSLALGTMGAVAGRTVGSIISALWMRAVTNRVIAREEHVSKDSD